MLVLSVSRNNLQGVGMEMDLRLDSHTQCVHSVLGRCHQPLIQPDLVALSHAPAKNKGGSEVEHGYYWWTEAKVGRKEERQTGWERR